MRFSQQAIELAGVFHEAGSKKQRRYLWAVVQDDVTSIGIPIDYPNMNPGSAAVYNVSPRLEWAHTADPTLVYKFGWSRDGRHWVLFGFDAVRDHAMIKEFPAVLAAIVSGDCIETGEDLSPLRRAWALTAE